MFRYCFVIVYFCIAAEALHCNPGFVAVNQNGLSKCVPCPSNFECSMGFPKACKKDHRNMGGSDYCCPKNITCPLNSAVYPHLNCECAPMVCNVRVKKLDSYELKQTNFYFESNSKDIGCSENDNCTECLGLGLTLINKNDCSCIKRRQTCQDKGKEQYWYSFLSNKFRCVSF